MQPHALRNLSDGASGLRRQGHSWPCGLFWGHGKVVPFSPGGHFAETWCRPSSLTHFFPDALPLPRLGLLLPKLTGGTLAFTSSGSVCFPPSEIKRRVVRVLVWGSVITQSAGNTAGWTGDAVPPGPGLCSWGGPHPLHAVTTRLQGVMGYDAQNTSNKSLSPRCLRNVLDGRESLDVRI